MRDQAIMTPLFFTMSLVKFGREKEDKKLILYNNINIIGNNANHWISIQRKNPLNSVDRVPKKRNSIMSITQEQN